MQHSISYSAVRGTVRGMHFQRAPHAEVKVVHCTKGALWDVIIDLRQDSPTYGRWQGFELTAENHRRLYVPKGFAHGFQTLEPDTEAGYLISEFYVPEAAAGVRFDDRCFGIKWPLPASVLSQKDASWPDLSAETLRRSCDKFALGHASASEALVHPTSGCRPPHGMDDPRRE